MNGKWNLCPGGGIDKLAPFVRLFGGNNLNVAVLSDIANGDKTKIENLKKADILKAGHFYTCADFVDQIEADVEDLFDADLFVEILNAAYKPPAKHVVTRESLMDAAVTPWIVKKAEALFKLMPPEVANFDHFGPYRWLLEHPANLDDDTLAVQTTLDRAQRLFETFNKLLG
ncbi:hypothetical protein [Janthinobacterium sp. RB2R34]|uniref:hypothetical protein n=1 Tax=Janthinobacterium sp. RB2R34 TaxID=3424193 RepID=UPI003F27ADDA